MKIIRRLMKRAQEGMPWYVIAAILALVFILIGFYIISKSGQGSQSVIDGLKEMI